MTSNKVCKNCQEIYEPNPRLRGRQLFCGKEECQRARKTHWEKQKNKNDPVYRERQKASKKKWRENYPCDKYQGQYRETHPEYVQQNRILQKTRNENRKKEKQFDFPANVKNNTYNSQIGQDCSPIDKDCKDGRVISESLIPSGLYAILPYNPQTGPKIVKMDALIVQLSNFKTYKSSLVDNSS